MLTIKPEEKRPEEEVQAIKPRQFLLRKEGTWSHKQRNLKLMKII